MWTHCFTILQVRCSLTIISSLCDWTVSVVRISPAKGQLDLKYLVAIGILTMCCGSKKVAKRFS